MPNRNTVIAHYLVPPFVLACLFFPSVSLGQVVAAKVDSNEITTADVDRQVRRIRQQRNIDPDALPMLQARVLESLVKQRLALAYLQSHKIAPSEKEIDLAVTRTASELDRQKKSLTSYLEDVGLSKSAFRDTLAWQLGWSRYLERFATRENLEGFFTKRKKAFDGTKLRVAHIVRVIPAADATARANAQTSLSRLRAQITGEELSFSEAAAAHSQSPSAKQGGGIGWIERHQPMPESFSAAAFQLEVGGVSQPVETPVGVHLICVLEEQPGNKTFVQVRSEVRKAAADFLLDWVANQQRAESNVQYTGKYPYLDPKTKQLVTQE